MFIGCLEIPLIISTYVSLAVIYTTPLQKVSLSLMILAYNHLLLYCFKFIPLLIDPFERVKLGSNNEATGTNFSCGVWTRRERLVLHPDNASAHSSFIVHEFLAKNASQRCLTHPTAPISLPCDLFLFPRWNCNSKELMAHEVKEALITVLNGLTSKNH